MYDAGWAIATRLFFECMNAFVDHTVLYTYIYLLNPDELIRRSLLFWRVPGSVA
jgi:hypothetical protein